MTFDVSKMVVDGNYIYDKRGFDQHIPTGMPPLDIALCGGVPLNGSLIEVYGEESHGKTTLTFMIGRRFVENSGYVTVVDTETTYDQDWASVNGLPEDKVIVYRPPYMEKASDIIIDDIVAYKRAFLPWLLDAKWKPPGKAKCSEKELEEIKAQMEADAPPHLIIYDTIANIPSKTVLEGNQYGGGMAS